jgi:hypothetical protein
MGNVGFQSQNTNPTPRHAIMVELPRVAGYVVVNDDQCVIGAGSTEDAALASVHDDEGDPTLWVVLPATERLLAEFDETGDPTWLTIYIEDEEVACLEEERDELWGIVRDDD